jgi:hypothetical protein
VRTTIDLPEDLLRTLKARAALGGVTLRELILRLIELGLQAGAVKRPASDLRRAPPPVVIPPTGMPIRAVSGDELARLEEADDEARHARSA